MKTTLYRSLLVLCSLHASSALAQTTPDLSTQVQHTRDFVSTLISRFSSAGVSRFTLSSDYSQAGLDVQNRASRALTEFRATMDILGQGAFPAAIERYNQIVADRSRSDRESRLAIEFKTLQILARAFQSTYQAAITGLFALEPSWVINTMSSTARIDAWNNYADQYYKVYCSWADGTRSKSKTETGESSETVCGEVARSRVRKTIFAACKTQTCISSLVSDYAAYFSDVMNSINRNIRVTLADGNVIEIAGLAARSDRSDMIMNSLIEFNFDLEFQNLPQRN